MSVAGNCCNRCPFRNGGAGKTDPKASCSFSMGWPLIISGGHYQRQVGSSLLDPDETLRELAYPHSSRGYRLERWC